MNPGNTPQVHQVVVTPLAYPSEPYVSLVQLYRRISWLIINATRNDRRINLVTTVLTVLTSSSLWGALEGYKYIGIAGLVISLVLSFLMIFQLQMGPAVELEKLKAMQRRVGQAIGLLEDTGNRENAEFHARHTITDVEIELVPFDGKGMDPKNMTASERQKWEQSHLQ